MTSSGSWDLRLRCALVLAGLFGTGTPVRAQGEFRAWIGLYDAAQVGWLENENRIIQLCSEPSTLEECYAQSLGPAVRAFDLHRGPDASSTRIGELIVVATPGRGLSAHFRPIGSGRVTTFVPDLFLPDWGYGPYFHQTLMDRHDEWYQLPPGPWQEAVWFRREPNVAVPTVLQVTESDVIEMDGSSWFVVAAEPEALLVRPEQPGDVWCEEGAPPPITPVEPKRVPRSELLDSLGHLKFAPKYLKGC